MLNILTTPQALQKLIQHSEELQSEELVKDHQHASESSTEVDAQESFFSEPSNFRISSLPLTQSRLLQQPQKRRVTIAEDLPSVSKVEVEYPEGYDESKLCIFFRTLKFCL